MPGDPAATAFVAKPGIDLPDFPEMASLLDSHEVVIGGVALAVRDAAFFCEPVPCQVHRRLLCRR